MLQFNVPQFIDVEDKIIGPMTLKQFGFIGGGGLLDVMLFKIFYPNMIFWLGIVPVTGAAAFMAFYKFNGRPIYNSMSTIAGYFTSQKIYIFKQEKLKLDLSLLVQQPAAKGVQGAEQLTTQQRSTQLRDIASLLDRKSAEETETLKVG